MALTELQLPEKERFYNDLRRIADEMYRYFESWAAANDFIADIDSDDLTSMGVTDSEVISDLIKLKTAVSEIVSLFDGESVTPTNTPKDVINKIRRMLPI